MKLLWAICFAVPVFAADVPNRYIVELATEPVAAHIRAQGRGAIHSLAAEQHRGRIRSEQATARRRIEQAGGVVTGAAENAHNSLAVSIDEARAAALAQLPGVRRVYPVREFHLLLDHALPLHRVPDAWTQVGVGNAGAGVRIGIIDTGIDASHPGFQDGGLTAPDGFPRGDPAYTSNKVIVARSYVSLLRNTDPDPSPADHIGHGTATAMAAAGVQAIGPLAIIRGVAPRAWIGSYKVFGSPAAGVLTTEDAVLRAIDDAVSDGMDVLNLSLGNDVALRVQDDPEMQALENAAALGIVVVCAAGNNGADPMTVGTPAGAPSVIAVGATANDRIFAARVLGPDGRQYAAVPGEGMTGASPVAGPLADIAAFDPTGLACATLPPNAVAGSIALIERGTCTFEVKLNNAQAAGAIGALVYNNVDDAPIGMILNSATLPAEMISKSDGLALRGQLTGPLAITLDFVPTAVYSNPSHLEKFSAAGPYVDFSIKPDLVAVGGNVYTAAQSLDAQGAIYSPTGFALEAGTSFSSPIVAGAAAVLKSARPGLTAAQYRSLLVNSAALASESPGAPAAVQQAGAGMLDLLAALNSTAAVAPVSLSFGAGAGSIHAVRNLTLWNLGTAAEMFRISVEPLSGSTVPDLPYDRVQVDRGASVTIPVGFSADGLAPGAYQGFLLIQGSRSNVTTRVAWWHGVGSGQPRAITMLSSPTTAGAGTAVPDALVFRVTDETGLPVVDTQPRVTSLSGGGAVTGIRLPGNVPYVFDVNARLGARPGANVFRIQVGAVTKDVTIIGQ